MAQVHFRFYAELNDFLPSDWRQVTFAHSLPGRSSVKDRIEALGVPHTEVDLILVNGASVDFSYLLQDGDHVSVYPVFEGLDISPVLRLRPHPLREPKFVLDAHLGKLASYLRLVGFDALYPSECGDAELAQLSVSQKRILLTQDRGLLKRRCVSHGYCVRATRPREQLREVLKRFDLRDLIAPFQRCLRCNGLLERVDKREVAARLPPNTREFYDEFYRCAGCGQVYWPGSHYQHLRRLVAEVLKSDSDNDLKLQQPG
jgi:uncharacterized protein with PIN domain